MFFGALNRNLVVRKIETRCFFVINKLLICNKQQIYEEK